MAVLEDLFNGWGTTTLVGLGIVVAAPVLLPAVSAVVRPVAKGLIKSGLFVAESVQGIMAEGGERFSDLLAEARSEHRRRGGRKD